MRLPRSRVVSLPAVLLFASVMLQCSSNGGGTAPGDGASGTSGNGGGTSGGPGSSGGASSGSGGASSSGGTTRAARINVRASGIPLRVGSGMRVGSVTSPGADEYEGMGVHSGESVVLGLKIRLTGITMAQKPPGQQGAIQGTVFDWSHAPKELQIEHGFAGAVEDSAPLALPSGSYQVVQVSYESRYQVKAYAYLDTNHDGEVDTTIYTSATGVKSVASKASPASLADLDYTSYGFTYSYNADSVTASTTTSGDITMLPAPVIVTADSLQGDAGGAANGGDAGDAGTADAGTQDLNVSLFIDAYRVVKAWDGHAPTSPGDHVDVIFPQGAAEGRTNQYGVRLLDLYPLGQPTFGLAYLPTFAFANAPGNVSETYLIAPAAPFTEANTQAVSIVFDGSGTPILGRTEGNVDAAGLQLGQAARMFEPLAADGGATAYRYYVEYGIKDANGNDDGGMYYHDDKTMAGHVVEGFRRLPNLGDTANVTVKDGPRCHAEYNRCFGDRSAVIRRVR